MTVCSPLWHAFRVATVVLLVAGPILAPADGSINVLPAWREAFPLLQPPAEAAEGAALDRAQEPHTPLPEGAEREALARLIERNRAALALHTSLATRAVFYRPETPAGPEAPFPDHGPLRQLARLVAAEARLLEAEGRRVDGGRRIADLLGLARLQIEGANGLIAFLHGSGVLETALDAAEGWLHRFPPTSARPDASGAVPPPTADWVAVTQALLDLEGSIDRGFASSLRGESELFGRIVARLPPPGATVEEYLDGISTLGQPDSPPVRPVVSRWGSPRANLLDAAATSRAHRLLIESYLETRAGTAFAPPPDAFARSWIPRRDSWMRQFGELWDVLAEGLPEDGIEPLQPLRAADLERVPNPFGRMLLILLMPAVDRFSEIGWTRETHRRALLNLAVVVDHHVRTGELPSSLFTAWRMEVLPAFADPFSGDALHYDPERGLLWSVGRNRRNDRGRNSDGINLGESPDYVWPLPPAIFPARP